MKAENLILGKRYKVPHGTGIIIGHESFYDNGYTSKIIKTICPKNTVRHVFKLDKGHTWGHNRKEYEFYYCAPKDIEEIT